MVIKRLPSSLLSLVSFVLFLFSCTKYLMLKNGSSHFFFKKCDFSLQIIAIYNSVASSSPSPSRSVASSSLTLLTLKPLLTSFKYGCL
ncbi:hypothetical protein I3760_12G127200 [Carya illinoinensis]|nr:hypothetical protein I3760_12G127200 [Carya illinoinensis]